MKNLYLRHSTGLLLLFILLFFTRKLVLAFGALFNCSDTILLIFNQRWQNMNTFWDLVEAVNRPSGSCSVRELVHLLHYYYINFAK